MSELAENLCHNRGNTGSLAALEWPWESRKFDLTKGVDVSFDKLRKSAG
jgi:hypothetical protein